MSKKIRALAIYLPQFHPIPENDEWWGKGFTEWTNVVKGKPIVKGHYQPHLPADLGFYDLRVPEVREAQAQMAKDAGIYGFVYYHYWFNGKRLLERPFNEVLESGKPDFPFCLCWANENWTRRWNGLDQEVLMKQEYSFDDDLNHIRYLCEHVFNDPRYIKVNGKPLFMVYKPSLFPDIKRTTEIWREEAKKYGYDDLYLVFFWTYKFDLKPEDINFDAAAFFPPNSVKLSTTINPLLLLLNKISMVFFNRKFNLSKTTKYNIYNYDNLISKSIKTFSGLKIKIFNGITPGWDNYVRRPNGGGRIILNSNPVKYQNWLETVCAESELFSNEENFIFINAWNEWAEGNHLEPCVNWGDKYLKATKRILEMYQ